MSAFGCFLLAAGAIVAAVVLFNDGFAGPAPLALGGAGGLVAAGIVLWRPPRTRTRPYPELDRHRRGPR